MITDPATGDTRELAFVPCTDFRSHATTTSAYLVTCTEDDGDFLVWQDYTDRHVNRVKLDWTHQYFDQRYDTPSSNLENAGIAVVPAPGAVVVARPADTEVLGFPTSGPR